MTTPAYQQTGSALRFSVELDAVKVGTFSACEGLTAEYEVQEVKEGGNNDFVHRFPGRVKYTNIKLSRAVDQSSQALATWFSTRQTAASFSTAKITLLDETAKALATWKLAGVWPVKYTGPQLNAATNGVATESLELAHHGFVQGAS